MLLTLSLCVKPTYSPTRITSISPTGFSKRHSYLQLMLLGQKLGLGKWNLPQSDRLNIRSETFYPSFLCTVSNRNPDSRHGIQLEASLPPNPSRQCLVNLDHWLRVESNLISRTPKYRSWKSR